MMIFRSLNVVRLATMSTRWMLPIISARTEVKKTVFYSGKYAQPVIALLGRTDRPEEVDSAFRTGILSAEYIKMN
ncbi:unnamed protein product [Toxocara canis]|uniref:ATP synthase subunit epsilon, mitochondrial n=1 Tax=Toxocara canis TaxID=6265 RepID=A0A183TWR0_TOXCA|nr:unnamed protein product [Toxocara canis]